MRRDTVVGLFSVILGVLYGAAALQIKNASVGGPWAPKVFPLGIAAFLVVLGASALVIDRAKARGGDKPRAAAAKDPGYAKLILGTVALCAIYGYTFEPFGYIVSTLCFMFLLLTLVNEPKRWKSNIIITLVFTFFLWGSFVYVFDIALPSFDMDAIKELFAFAGGGVNLG
ncbi:hypothetical protein AGMMS49957_17920 [Synergistales bacterium]|nr:hypothetical protein AGMMS49957_17920 [Synergistales bacterium]